MDIIKDAKDKLVTGVKSKYMMLKYHRHSVRLEKIYKYCLDQATFKCKFCGIELGQVNEIPVTEFLEHLYSKHRTDVDVVDVNSHLKFLRKHG